MSEAILQEPSSAATSFPPAAPVSSASVDLKNALLALLQSGSALPLPGAGRTFERWQALAGVAATDLSLVKLYEGHTDAIAILAELGGPALPAGATCGTWAAEAGEKLRFIPAGAGRCRLDGPKFWCSGARLLTHALLTAWEEGKQRLALVDLRQPGVTVTGKGWAAVGMAATASGNVLFDDVPALAIGGPGAYLNRSGFWHGGAGIAACWYGATAALAEALREGARRNRDPHALAIVGALDARLVAARALFVQLAAQIDAGVQGGDDDGNDGGDEGERLALRARTLVELTAREVLASAARSLGAYGFCKDARLARLQADLPVYLSQSHAERDWQRLGELACLTGKTGWAL